MTYCPKNAQAFNSRPISDEHAADWCRRVYRPGLAQCEGCDLFASILASKNVPLVEIQKMLRHGSIQTTARYIHSLQEGSREALAALPGIDQQNLIPSDSSELKIKVM